MLDLYDIEGISATLRLHWQNVVATFPVDADIYFIGLDLANLGYSSAEMVL